MQATRLLTAQNVEFLKQGRRLILMLDDETYRQGLPPIATSGIGSHFRHCLDFYRGFVEGLATGRVDYDLRSRDRSIESDRDKALELIDRMIHELEMLGSSINPDRELDVSLDSPEEMAEQPVWSRSSVLRELQALTAHTVHHYALIAILLKARGFDPGETFGVAPSTLKHEKTSLAQASC